MAALILIALSLGLIGYLFGGLVALVVAVFCSVVLGIFLYEIITKS